MKKSGRQRQSGKGTDNDQSQRGFRFSLPRLFPVQLILALAVSMVMTASARALDCENAMTTADMSQCAQLDYQRADDELNAVYQHLRSMQDKKANLLLRDAPAGVDLLSGRRMHADCRRFSRRLHGGTGPYFMPQRKGIAPQRRVAHGSRHGTAAILISRPRFQASALCQALSA